MTVDELKKNLHDVIERYRDKAEFTGEVRRDVMARDCLHVVEELQAENERLKKKGDMVVVGIDTDKKNTCRFDYKDRTAEG